MKARNAHGYSLSNRLKINNYLNAVLKRKLWPTKQKIKSPTIVQSDHEVGVKKIIKKI